jgi:hypothetical protein
MRLSRHRLTLLLKLAELYVRSGWRVTRPIYVDWFWRGFSIDLEPPEALEFPCPRCGGPTIHYCGMGACVDRCLQCDKTSP